MGGTSKASRGVFFYRVAATCCIYYVLAQLVQEVVFHLGINDSPAGEAEILQRLTSLDQFRAIVVLLGFSLIPVLPAYASVALRRYPFRPAVSLLGFGFSLLFVGSEASVRSIDFFLVSRKWAAAYQAASTEAIRHAIAGRIQIWDDAIGAFYYALLGVCLLSSACFALACWDNDRWNRMVAVGFASTAIESASRLAEGYLGQTWMSAANNVAYFPIVLLNFGTLAAWLWREAPAGG